MPLERKQYDFAPAGPKYSGSESWEYDLYFWMYSSRYRLARQVYDGTTRRYPRPSNCSGEG